MFGDAAEEEVSKDPLSNNTVSRRINEMSRDIEMNVNGRLQDIVFVLQLDESTYASEKCQVLVFVRFEENSDITEQFLFCRKLTTTTGCEIFYCINAYFEEHEIKWAHCVSVCTDSALALTGQIKGFLVFVKKLNSTLITTHCFLH
jgi:hypothetical protein